MEELRREQMCDKTDILLFDIFSELKNISKLLVKSQSIESVPILEEESVKSNNKACKHCGKTHERPIDYAICSKRSKKDGAKNE